MKLQEAQQLIYTTLQELGIESFVAESLLILESLGFSSLDIVMKPGDLSQAQEQHLKTILERRAKREPLQHILGYAHFYDLKLKVTPDVLIPRPETENLVEIALEIIKDIQEPVVLDIGTGSGAIALVIKHECPRAQIMATDISEKALVVAMSNAQEHQLEITFIQADLFNHPRVKAMTEQAHLIVANLPYLPLSDQQHLSPEVLHDPERALYSGDDGLEHFRKFMDAVLAVMKTSAKQSDINTSKVHLLFELDPRNIDRAYSYCTGWQAKIYKDLVGRERFLYLIPVQHA
jgi:release factor glutamine methyltransferase